MFVYLFGTTLIAIVGLIGIGQLISSMANRKKD
jgi:hypothetical protein